MVAAACLLEFLKSAVTSELPDHCSPYLTVTQGMVEKSKCDLETRLIEKATKRDER